MIIQLSEVELASSIFYILFSTFSTKHSQQKKFVRREYMSPKNKYKKRCKVVFCGESGCGKTSLIHRLVHDVFIEESVSTIGANYLVLDEGEHEIQIWDTAGQERYSSLLPIYFRNAEVVIYCYSCTSPDSINMDKMKATLLMTDVNSEIIFVNTKTDLESIHTPIVDKLNQFCKENSFGQYLTSAKNGTGIEELKDLLLKCRMNIEETPKTVTIHTEYVITESKYSRCCL